MILTLFLEFLSDSTLLTLSSVSKAHKKRINQILLERDGSAFDSETEKWLHNFLAHAITRTYPEAILPTFNEKRILGRHNLSANARADLIFYFLKEKGRLSERSISFLRYVSHDLNILPSILPEIVSYFEDPLPEVLQVLEEGLKHPAWQIRQSCILSIVQLALTLPLSTEEQCYYYKKFIIYELLAEGNRQMSHPAVIKSLAEAARQFISIQTVRKQSEMLDMLIQVLPEISWFTVDYNWIRANQILKVINAVIPTLGRRLQAQTYEKLKTLKTIANKYQWLHQETIIATGQLLQSLDWESRSKARRGLFLLFSDEDSIVRNAAVSAITENMRIIGKEGALEVLIPLNKSSPFELAYSFWPSRAAQARLSEIAVIKVMIKEGLRPWQFYSRLIDLLWCNDRNVKLHAAYALRETISDLHHSDFHHLFIEDLMHPFFYPYTGFHKVEYRIMLLYVIDRLIPVLNAKRQSFMYFELKNRLFYDRDSDIGAMAAYALGQNISIFLTDSELLPDIYSGLLPDMYEALRDISADYKCLGIEAIGTIMPFLDDRHQSLAFSYFIDVLEQPEPWNSSIKMAANAISQNMEILTAEQKCQASTALIKPLLGKFDTSREAAASAREAAASAIKKLFPALDADQQLQIICVVQKHPRAIGALPTVLKEEHRLAVSTALIRGLTDSSIDIQKISAYTIAGNSFILDKKQCTEVIVQLMQPDIQSASAFLITRLIPLLDGEDLCMLTDLLILDDTVINHDKTADIVSVINASHDIPLNETRPALLFSQSQWDQCFINLENRSPTIAMNKRYC